MVAQFLGPQLPIGSNGNGTLNPTFSCRKLCVLIRFHLYFFQARFDNPGLVLRRITLNLLLGIQVGFQAVAGSVSVQSRDRQFLTGTRVAQTRCDLQQ